MSKEDMSYQYTIEILTKTTVRFLKSGLIGVNDMELFKFKSPSLLIVTHF